MQTYIEIILLGYIFYLIFTREYCLLCVHGWAGQTQLSYWRRISQSEIRNSAAAEKNWNRKTRPTESGASEQPNAPQFSKCLEWSGRRDSNPESPDPKSGMLAVTPRPDLYNFKINNRFIVFGDLSLFISIIL